LYWTITVIKDGMCHKVSVIEDRADHIVTLDKNEEDYKGKLERTNYTKIKTLMTK
jgi:hypothetical protein